MSNTNKYYTSTMRLKELMFSFRTNDKFKNKNDTISCMPMSAIPTFKFACLSYLSIFYAKLKQCNLKWNAVF